MTQPIVILGTGGSAYDALDTIQAANAVAPAWSIAGFLDDAREPGSRYLGFPILGRLCEASLFLNHLFINTIGSDKSYLRRPEIIAGTALESASFASIVHPASSVSAFARIGRGVQVNFGVSIGGGAAIGNHVFLGPNCTIGHDAVIEDYAIVAPGATISGFVTVGRICYIGAAASIRQQLKIGPRSLIGIGAVVIRDVEAEDTVVGNPARSLRRAGTEVRRD